MLVPKLVTDSNLARLVRVMTAMLAALSGRSFITLAVDSNVNIISDAFWY